MNVPKDLKYTKTHEWVRELSESKVRIGLTDYAQSELGDLVFVNLPAVEDQIVMGETFADVESVKAVSDIYSPVTGKIDEVNEALNDNPGEINTNCYEAWLVEVVDVSRREELLSAEAYEQLIEAEG